MLKHFIRPARVLTRRRYLAARPFCQASSGASQLPDEKRVIELLGSPEPLNAYPLIKAICDSGKVIPSAIMSHFYDVVKATGNPFHTDLFARLVTVNQVGPENFTSNVDRVIHLYLQQLNWEMCIAFIREVELANKGEHAFSYDTLESILISAKWHNDIEIAFQVVQIIHGTYPNVYGRTWGLLAQLSLDTEDYECLKWLHKVALVPGLLVLDDASYMRLARIAALNGDLRMCEWAALRMRRRQRALNTGSPTDSLQLYIYLIEAASRSSVANGGKSASIKAVCRYLVRLGEMAPNVSICDLPQTVAALVESESNDKYVRELFDTICHDATVDSGVKTLIFNLLLAAKASSPNTTMNEITDIVRGGGAHMGIDLNEDSVVCLLDLAKRFQSGRDTYEAIAAQCSTPRVERILKRCLA